MSLRVYTVHRPPAPTTRWDARDPLPELVPELVKEGFCWPAFVFGLAWTLYHRLWIASAILFALIAGLGVVFEQLRLGQLSLSLISFAIAVLVGLLGNDWRRAALRRRGYSEDGVVTAANLETALRRYLDLQAIAGAAPRVAPAPARWRAPDAGPWSGVTGGKP
jgi:hypothetical protein